MTESARNNLERKRRRHAGTTTAVLCFYIVLFLLNAASLHNSVSRLPFGPTRRFWMAALGPCARAAERLHLDWPRNKVEEYPGDALNRD